MFKELLKALTETVVLMLFAHIRKTVGDKKPKPQYDEEKLPWEQEPRPQQNPPAADLSGTDTATDRYYQDLHIRK